MDTYLKIFIVAASVAVLLQAGVLIATYLAVARVERETRALRRHLNEQSGPILSNLTDITLTVRENSRIIFDDLTALTSDARRQVVKFDRLTDEVADRLRAQILRLDELMTVALDNLEHAGGALKDTIGAPMREAAAVIQGVKAVIDLISARRSRPRQPGRAGDEQLFI